MRYALIEVVSNLVPPLGRLRRQRDHLHSENLRILAENQKLSLQIEKIQEKVQFDIDEKAMAEASADQEKSLLAKVKSEQEQKTQNSPVAPYTFKQLLNHEIPEAEMGVVLHLHVPKAAGNSVMLLLGQNGYQQIDLYPPTNDFFQWIDEQEFYRRYREKIIWRPHVLSGHFKLDHPIYRKIRIPYCTITTLRHPIDQLLSHYNFAMRFLRAPFHDDIASGRMSFLEFAANMQKAFGPQFRHFDDTGEGAVTPTGTATVQLCFDNLLTRVAWYGFSDRFTEFSVALGYLLGLRNVLFVDPQNRTVDYRDLTGVPLKTSLTAEEEDGLGKLCQDDVWFYEQAKIEYERRIAESALKEIIARAAPLEAKYREATAALMAIDDPAAKTRSSFDHLR